MNPLALLIGCVVGMILLVHLGFWITFGVISVVGFLALVFFLPSDVKQMFGPYFFLTFFVVAAIVGGSYWLATHISFH